MVFFIYYLSMIANRACLPLPSTTTQLLWNAVGGWNQLRMVLWLVLLHGMNTCASSLCKLMHLSQIIAIELFFFSFLLENTKSM
jgi:hypothetical protein